MNFSEKYFRTIILKSQKFKYDLHQNLLHNIVLSEGFRLKLCRDDFYLILNAVCSKICERPT